MPTTNAWTMRGVPFAGGVASTPAPHTFVIEPNEYIEIVMFLVKLTASATVGNRQVVLELQNPDGTAVFFGTHPEVVQAAGSTMIWQMGQGLPYGGASAKRDSESFATMPLPTGFMLLPGSKLMVYDATAVDEAGDRFVISYSGLYRPVGDDQSLELDGVPAYKSRPRS